MLKLKDTPKGLLNAVSGIMQSSAQKYAEEQAAAQMKYAQGKMKEMPQGKGEKPVAKGAEKMAEAMDPVNKKALMKSFKDRTDKDIDNNGKVNKSDEYLHNRRKAISKSMGEGWEDMMKAVKDKAAEKGTGKFDKKKVSTGTVYTRKTNKDGTSKMSEETDTPGNSTHQCAIHVKSEQFGEGRTLFSQHAEPDADGQIAWYDVMFDEGIKRVETKDIEILVSESHMNHKKKKKMSEETLDELNKSTMVSYAKKAEADIKDKQAQFKAAGGDMRKKSQRELDKKIGDRFVSMGKAQRKAGLPAGFTKEEVEQGDADHLHVAPVGKGKYKVHSVGKNFSDGIKKGEHLSDSELDDASEMGAKIKHIGK